MRLLLLFMGFTFFCWSIYGKDLRATLEYVNVTYVNPDFGEVTVELVYVSKLTTKVKGTVRFYYEPNDKLMITGTVYKLGANNKAYKVTQITRSVKSAMLFGESIPFVQEIAPKIITPNLYWPPRANVTYTLHEYWLPQSKVPVIDLPIPIVTGRLKLIGLAKYINNNTVIIKGEAVGRLFYSDQNYD